MSSFWCQLISFLLYVRKMSKQFRVNISYFGWNLIVLKGSEIWQIWQLIAQLIKHLNRKQKKLDALIKTPFVSLWSILPRGKPLTLIWRSFRIWIFWGIFRDSWECFKFFPERCKRFILTYLSIRFFSCTFSRLCIFSIM